MQNKDKGDGIEDSPLDMLLVILLKGASKEVVMPSLKHAINSTSMVDATMTDCFALFHEIAPLAKRYT